MGDPAEAQGVFCNQAWRNCTRGADSWGWKRAVGRLVRAIQSREKILLYGDYDVDGDDVDRAVDQGD